MDLKKNSGVIFRNEKKSSENHPDYRGEIDCDGIRKEIALWVKESSGGKKYFSASLSEPYRKPMDTPPPPVEEQGETDDLPF